ncbi:MAG: tRNA glutamyl-Q(34) synthetase GluQRS [Lautropia sp.]|nr:tRNA glutamyl-Q(34) synthetase GluQRS [Lautropia sp.]
MNTATPPCHYIGRFAPSPSGPLHAGSVVAALASWLDARAHDGQWLLRIEDIDPPRVEPGADARIRHQLRFLGLHWDAPPWYQSARTDRYQAALKHLQAQGLIFGCGCTRREIARAWAAWQARHPAITPPTHDETPYLGTCRHGLPPGRQARAWRFRVSDAGVDFDDRWLGPQRQQPSRDCGDVVLKRADGVWAYQLAVVVDDAEAGITDIVRGADLLPSTGRQILLQQALGHPKPRYLHLPLLMGDNGQKLSKQNGAPAVDDSGRTEAADILNAAARFLEIKPPGTNDPVRWLAAATEQWRTRLKRLAGARLTAAAAPAPR